MYPGEPSGPRGCGVWGCAIEMFILAGMKPSGEDLVGARGLWLCFPAFPRITQHIKGLVLQI